MILLIGGTRESRSLMEILEQKHIDFISTVTTSFGKKLAQTGDAKVYQGALSYEEMEDFIRKHSVDCIVDASHPFAEEVSRNAIGLAEKLDISYYRLERPSLNYPSYVKKVGSIGEIASLEKDRKGTIYLSTGSKASGDFLKVFEKDSLVFRILPLAKQLKSLEEKGISPAQIHAISPPFSYELNQALFKKVEAKVLVSKDSGQAGGMEEKIRAAHDLGMDIYIIERPKIAYPRVYHRIEELVNDLEREENF